MSISFLLVPEINIFVFVFSAWTISVHFVSGRNDQRRMTDEINRSKLIS